MARSDRIRVPMAAAIGMIRRYTWARVREQIQAVAFVVVYLVAFQILAFGSPPGSAIGIAVGVGLVVIGLALFLEGLRLGLMPLGERVGIQLPGKGGLAAIIAFGLLVGVGSTLAEPAIAALRVAGRGTAAWEAPLLYALLERMPEMLVIAVGAGVGVAVALGLTRFYFGFSLKPLILTVIPILLALTVLFSLSDDLAHVIGLAWDTGAVTTGAVTVPLVLALGIGVSRAARRSDGAGTGFGVVMLASAFPVLGVMALAAIIAPGLPKPVSEAEFFSSGFRDQALVLFDDEAALTRYAFVAGSEAGRRAAFETDELYTDALAAIATDPAARTGLLAAMPLQTWLAERASESERAVLRAAMRDTPHADAGSATAAVGALLIEESVSSLRAVVPLTLLLLAVLVLMLRDRPRYLDEVALGIVVALIGMALLTSGIRLGLGPLGDEIGSRLPEYLSPPEVSAPQTVISGFDPASTFPVAGSAEPAARFFHFHDGERVTIERFDPQRFDPLTGRYTHVGKLPFRLGGQYAIIGVVIVVVFAFGLGYGSTLAEPALATLARTVEDLTVGTVRRSSVVRAVSIGVGLGLVAGVIRMMADIPITWLLIPPYLLLLPLTIISEETFTGIAWDCGGVTTGTITVPLVMAMGLGLGRSLGVVDGFGILALASAYPIVCVLAYGLIIRMRQRRIIREAATGGDDGTS